MRCLLCAVEQHDARELRAMGVPGSVRVVYRLADGTVTDLRPECPGHVVSRAGETSSADERPEILRSLMVCGTKIRSGNQVSLSGWSHSLVAHVTLSGQVDTMCASRGRAEFKVWPDADIGNGKIWFYVVDVESISVLEP